MAMHLGTQRAKNTWDDTSTMGATAHERLGLVVHSVLKCKRKLHHMLSRLTPPKVTYVAAQDAQVCVLCAWLPCFLLAFA